MADNSNADRIKQIKAEDAAQRNLAKILQDRITKTGDLTKMQKDLVDRVSGQQDIESKLLSVQEAKEEVLLRVAKFNRQIDKDMLKQLDTAEEYLKLEKKRKDLQEEIKDIGEEFKDDILASVGLSSNLLKHGFALGVAFAAGQKALSMISSAFESSVGLAKELYTQVGATGAESARLGAQTMGALFSMEGLLYGGEALATAAKDTADYYGSTQMITSDMQKNVTKLSAMGVQGAAEMNAIFGQAAGSAGDMTDSIETIAAKSGITTAALMTEMDGSMTRMVGKSKEQLETFAKQTAELKQQGASMELMNKAADGMLDIENSIKANMKARAFGIGIETDAIREAAMAYQYGEGSASDLAKAIQDQVGSAEEFSELGEKQKEFYADQVGMSKEDLATMLLKEEEMQKLRNEYAGMSDEQIAKIQEQEEAWQATKTTLMSLGSTILGAVIPPLLQYFAISKAMKAMNTMGGGTTPTTGTGGFMNSLSSINMGAVLQGAAAMLVVAAAVFVFGKALQEFTQVGWKEVGMAVVSMLALVGAVALLGMLMQGPVGAGVLIGAAAMLIVAGAMWVLGEAIQGVATGFQMLGSMGEQFGALVTMIPGLLALTGIFAMMGVALIGLSVGLAAVSLFLPTLMVLGLVLPLIAGALGFGGGEESSNESGGGSENNALLEEIKGLRMDIQNQPMQIVIDDKVVSTINKKNTRMEGYRKQMK